MEPRVPRFTDPGLAGVVEKIARSCAVAGGRAFLVGGSVRDAQLGRAALEADLEVYGIDPEALEKLAAGIGKVHLVGRQFAVLHVATPHGLVEMSLPRRESKTGPGHKGFAVNADPNLPLREAARRRDFTVNAMLQDPLTGELLDPWDGLADLHAGVLRHVSPAFAEDPLRAMRAARFVSRFGWSIHADTAALCRKLDLSELPMERMEGEWRQILVRGDHPGAGLNALETVGALRWFPEIEAMRGTPQDPIWHPEGDVFHHTALALDAAVAVRPDMADPWIEMLGLLCHDLGKPAHTCLERGRWRSPNHDVGGVAPTLAFLQRITRQESVHEAVTALVREHLRPMQLYQAREQVKDGAIRRLALRVDLEALLRVAYADAAGRYGNAAFADWPPVAWLRGRAAQLGVDKGRPEPFLRGRDLIELGVAPGPGMGEIIDEAFDLQIEGQIVDRDAALGWLRERVAR
ncbi:MAG TPA: polynucleotide adenylyltransferase [Planctomycetota bacterium]